jgi:hypothetical protein
MKITPALPVATLLLHQFISAVRTERSPIAIRCFAYCLSGATVGLIFFLLLVPTMLIGSDDNIRHLRTWYTDVVANERLGETHNFKHHGVRNQSLNNAVDRLSNWLANTTMPGPDDRGSGFPTAPPVQFPIEEATVRTMLVVPQTLLALLLIVVAVRWH